MCLILFAYKADPDYPLLLAANRDEFYARPTALADYWEGDTHILAGRDLQQGGTWLGISRSGRLAAITNYRDPEGVVALPLSRGQLTLAFLNSSLTSAAYIDSIRNSRTQYAGYNLLLGDGDSLWYYSNTEDQPRALGAGVYGLSNALLDTPWPKVATGKQQMQALLGQHPDAQRLAQCVSDRRVAADTELPDTGVGLERERFLSPQFIVTESYGTRATTAITINNAGDVAFFEKSFSAGGEFLAQREYEFTVEP